MKNIVLNFLLTIIFVHISTFCVLALRIPTNVTDIYNQGLYSWNDDIVILTNNTFKIKISNSSEAWLVEFYSSWCGHCQRFAPLWKAFATDIKEWNDLVKVAALDCSQDENQPICGEYEVTAYPTLRYFHEGYREGLGKAIQKGQNIESQRHFLLEAIQEEKENDRGKQYPLPEEYLLDDLGSSFQGLENQKFVFLVIQNNESFLGNMVALDFHRIPDIHIRWSLNNTGLLNRYGIEDIPVVIAIDRQKNLKFFNCNDSRDNARKAISEYLTEHNIFPKPPPQEDISTRKWLEEEPSTTSGIIKMVKQMGDTVFQIDLEATLRYSLNHEILSTKIIAGEKLQVLRAYFRLLENFFPFNQNGKVFLKELSKEAAQDPLYTSTLRPIIQRAELEERRVFSSSRNWLGCHGSSKSYRGYPCGLWKLFHYLTVNAADDKQYDALQVLPVMYGYIKYFFGCADCSQHFQKMALERQIMNVSSPEAAVLWLWKAHNEVNLRLAGDQTEDPEFPKQEFPSNDRCLTCRNEDKTWNETEVLKYLMRMYRKMNVKYALSDMSLLHNQHTVFSNSEQIFVPKLVMALLFMLLLRFI